MAARPPSPLTPRTASTGGAAAFFSDFFFVVHDRALMELGFTNTGAALDRDFETELAQKVYNRVGDNAASVTGLSRRYTCMTQLSDRSAWLTLTIVALIALAGCGGKAHKADPAADLALAKRAVLTAADLPGYTGKAHTPDDDIPAGAKKEFASCMGTTTSIFDDTPGAQKADSPDFDGASGIGLTVSNSIEIDPTKSDIDKGWEQISKPSVESCLGKLFDAAFKQGSLTEPGVKVGTFKVDRFDVGVGDRSVGYEAVVPVSGKGRTAVVYLDLVFVPRDRAGMDFTFTSVGKAFDRALEKTLAQKVYDRVGSNAK